VDVEKNGSSNGGTGAGDRPAPLAVWKQNGNRDELTDFRQEERTFKKENSQWGRRGEDSFPPEASRLTFKRALAGGEI